MQFYIDNQRQTCAIFDRGPVSAGASENPLDSPSRPVAATGGIYTASTHSRACHEWVSGHYDRVKDRRQTKGRKRGPSLDSYPPQVGEVFTADNQDANKGRLFPFLKKGDTSFHQLNCLVLQTYQMRDCVTSVFKEEHQTSGASPYGPNTSTIIRRTDGVDLCQSSSLHFIDFGYLESRTFHLQLI